MTHKKEYEAYLKSDKWAQIKLDIIQIRGEKCERCGEKEELHLHHLTYKRLFAEMPEDLELICRDCHKAEHGITKRKRRRKPKDQKMPEATLSQIKILESQLKHNEITCEVYRNEILKLKREGCIL